MILANGIAWPVAWMGADAWLQNFAFRITPGIQTFIIAGFLATVIAFFTVGYQAIKAALTNPVTTLRYE